MLAILSAFTGSALGAFIKSEQGHWAKTVEKAKITINFYNSAI